MRFSMLLAAFFIISWSSVSSALATSNIEGIFSSALLSNTACRAVTLPSTGMSKPYSRSPSLLKSLMARVQTQNWMKFFKNS